MEGLKHTKGPWKYEKGDDECHPDMHFVCWEGTGCEETTICETHYGEHDARLIAAAPDMLEALISSAKRDALRIGGINPFTVEAIETATGMRINEVLKAAARQEAER